MTRHENNICRWCAELGNEQKESEEKINQMKLIIKEDSLKK